MWRGSEGHVRKRSGPVTAHVPNPVLRVHWLGQARREAWPDHPEVRTRGWSARCGRSARTSLTAPHVPTGGAVPAEPRSRV